MLQINFTEFRQNLSSYLDRVARGERFQITVRGKVVARLAPDEDEAQKAYQRILQYRKNSFIGDVTTPLDVVWSGDDENQLCQ